MGTHPPAVPPARRRCCACHPRNIHTHVAGCDAWSAPRLPSSPSAPLYSAHPPPYSVALHSTPALASVPSAILPQELRPAPFLPVMPGLRHPYCHSHLHPHHPHHLLPFPLPTTTHPPTHPPPPTPSHAKCSHQVQPVPLLDCTPAKFCMHFHSPYRSCPTAGALGARPHSSLFRMPPHILPLKLSALHGGGPHPWPSQESVPFRPGSLQARIGRPVSAACTSTFGRAPCALNAFSQPVTIAL